MMKKAIFILNAAIIAVMVSGCHVTSQYAKFTSTDKLYQVETGSSYETVVSTLGCEPYNLLCKQADGYDIYVYKYKIVERWADPKYINERGSESCGDEIYKGKEETAFLIFKDNKLESILTGEGRRNASQVVLLNNTLYTISRDSKGEYVLIPTSLQEPEEKGVLLDFHKKK